MTRGPSRKPNALKRLEGTYRQDRDGGNHPSPPPETPNCPTWLGREAKRIWKRLAPVLARNGLLSKTDRATFAAFCQAYHRWWELEKGRDNTPHTFTTESGYTQRHPIHSMADDAMDRLTKLGREFGMTPSARSGIELPGPVEDNDTSEFLKRRFRDTDAA